MKTINKLIASMLAIGLVFIRGGGDERVFAMDEGNIQMGQQYKQGDLAITGRMNVLVIGEKGVGKSIITNYMIQNLKGEFPVDKNPVQHAKVYHAQNNPRCNIVEIDVDELLNNTLDIKTKFLVDNANFVIYVGNEDTMNFENYKKFYNGFNRIWINNPKFEFSPYGDYNSKFWNDKFNAISKEKYGHTNPRTFVQPRYLFNIFNGNEEQISRFNKFLVDKSNLEFKTFVSSLPDARNINIANLSEKVNLNYYYTYIMEATETLVNVDITDAYSDDELKKKGWFKWLCDKCSGAVSYLCGTSVHGD